MSVPEYAEKVKEAVLGNLVASLVEVGEEEVLNAWRSQWDSCWECGVDPRTSTSEHVMCSTYQQWMSLDVAQPAPYVNYSGSIPCQHLVELMQFRLGVHWLRVTTGRWERGEDGSTLPRHLRVCCKCVEGAVEDERHVLMPWSARPMQLCVQGSRICMMAVMVTWHKLCATKIKEGLRCWCIV